MVLNRAGNLLYVSDSFQGAIFRISNPATCDPCGIEMINHDPLLATAGFPPFGANGLALSHDENTLYIANTGDDRVLKLDLTVPPLTPNSVSVVAESINGADGLARDRHGRLWVAANQADEVVALNEDGKVVAKLGEFRGIRGNGTPIGLLFPASLVIVDDEIFVTNLALPLNGIAGDEPEEDVTRWTISRLKMPRH
jgi:DNA-binding beta-propeller fold protein YncE